MTSDSNAVSAPAAGGNSLSQLADLVRNGAIFILLVLLMIGFTLAQPAFIGINNLMSILQAVAVVAILGAGVTISMAVGGFDLSVGAVAASSVMAASYAMIVWRLDALLTVPLVLAFGATIGIINSFLIVRLRIPDMLATLAMMFLLTGLQLIPTAASTIRCSSPSAARRSAGWCRCR
ncbi:MAG: inner-rane translocator [Proteobacteria bacterium]|nr:inner-rane translocator [Pseudomonadota bacterium]